MSLELHTTTPPFTLLDQNGERHSLGDYLGYWVLLYFYPKDMTPGCTTEACAIRDVWAEYRAAGIVVLGISADSVASHKKFADKHQLSFALLADTEKEVAKAYNVWKPKKFMGKEFLGIMRQSFLIDPTGKLAKVYEKVKPELHANEVLADVETLS